MITVIIIHAIFCAQITEWRSEATPATVPWRDSQLRRPEELSRGGTVAGLTAPPVHPPAGEASGEAFHEGFWLIAGEREARCRRRIPADRAGPAPAVLLQPCEEDLPVAGRRGRAPGAAAMRAHDRGLPTPPRPDRGSGPFGFAAWSISWPSGFGCVCPHADLFPWFVRRRSARSSGA